MTLSSLFGLDQPVRALRKALDAEQLAGTYLFVGPAGVGKTALARAFGQAAACLDPRRSPFDGCGVCESCRRAQAGAHPEIVLIPPAGDQTQIWQFWDRDNRPPGILQHSLSFAPAVGRRRVYIIERADTLTEPAANSLLKALEEPPPYALFVLLSPQPARMLPTILSRAQMVRLTPTPVSDLSRWLAEAQGLEPERAGLLAAYAEGRVGTALRMARNPAVEGEIGRAVELAEALAGAPHIRALKLAEQLRKLAGGLKALVETDEAAAANTAGSEENGEPAAKEGTKEKVGRRHLGTLLELVAAVYRDLLALRLGGPEARIVHAGQRAALAALSTRRTPEGWMAAIEALLLARRRVDQNASIPLLTDWLALTLANG